jgi:putative DNA primase/helicase
VTASLQEIAAALGGYVCGDCVRAPGSGHSADDDSLSVRPARNDNGFTAYSFSGDDWQACVAHVRAKLDPERRAALAALGAALPARDDKAERGEDDPLGPGWYSRSLAPKVEGGPRALDERRQRIERARETLDESVLPLRTPTASYLWAARHLDLPPDVAGEVVRHHPRCPWKDELTNKTFQTHAVIAALRDVRTDELVGIVRTRLSLVEQEGALVGAKVGRRALGAASGAAIKLDRDDTVTHGLAIAEGLETAMTARQLGLRPVWALGSKGQIAKFPVLSGIESLTILAEPDAEAEVRECAQRWHAAGREVLINRPIGGKDLNDALRGVA